MLTLPILACEGTKETSTRQRLESTHSSWSISSLDLTQDYLTIVFTPRAGTRVQEISMNDVNKSALWLWADGPRKN